MSLPPSELIFPDTNILFHQIDLMEHDSIKNVIILQTVLQELKHKSTSIYSRIRNMIEKKNIIVFCNEHHRETYVRKNMLESPNDRNDRAIRRAVEWYGAHLEHLGVKSIFLTDDNASREAAVNDGLSALSTRAYVESRVDAPELSELITGLDDSSMDPKDAFSYKEHLSQTQMSAGLKSGAFHQGSLQISPINFLQGSVILKINHEETTVHIIGREDLNRGVHGDIVAVQLLPKSQWKSEVSEIQAQEEDVIDKVDGDEEGVVNTQEDTVMDTTQNVIPTGVVVGIIKRNWRPYCGTIEAASVKTMSTMTALQSVFFWSMDKRIPKIRIRTRQASKLIGKRIIVAIDAWTKTSRYPSGHFVRILGDVGEKQTETEVLLLEHDVPFAPFAPSVLSCLPEEGEGWIVNDSHLDNRVDFRGLDICSIDPPGCTDIDDALHARLMENGNYEVGVHIADVSHFVKPENAMDLEAQRRGTTVYLVDKRIDMLPSLLGTSMK